MDSEFLQALKDETSAARVQAHKPLNQVKSIVVGCSEERNNFKEDMKLYAKVIQESEMKFKEFEWIMETLRNMEGIDSTMLRKLFKYIEKQTDEEFKEAKEVIAEYRSSTLDPCRFIVAWENKL